MGQMCRGMEIVLRSDSVTLYFVPNQQVSENSIRIKSISWCYCCCCYCIVLFLEFVGNFIDYLMHFRLPDDQNTSTTFRSAGTLVLAEHSVDTLNSITLNAVTAATKLGAEVSVVVAGANVAKVAEQVGHCYRTFNHTGTNDAALDVHIPRIAHGSPSQRYENQQYCPGGASSDLFWNIRYIGGSRRGATGFPPLSPPPRA
ncbi:unnamed protein product [Gongylonema pulchrum]|uniref:PPC domain-containing protein n=1 Tax=Gongylonema pulchrum TaxID=637853 RepID=A0A183EGN9_9BILA|nr:unnamed protein product [Gongylonema pulchrum]